MSPTEQPTPPAISERQEKILIFIADHQQENGYPPSVREIGNAVGLESPSSVHSQLKKLQKLGYLRRDADRTRAIEVRYDPRSGTIGDKSPVVHVPLLGDVAAGSDVLAQQSVEELMPLPADFTGEGELFMLRVRGESMIEAGVLDGDFVVVRRQETAELHEMVVAGIPGDEATVKTLKKYDSESVVLQPHNPELSDMTFQPGEVTIYGKVVTVLRRL